MLSSPDTPVVIIGAGPAGLTAGYLLAGLGRPVLVIEADEQVGGLAKTVVRDGYRFDLGGHRFFTKSAEVEALWHEVLGEELLLRPRLSRIYWNERFLDYPLSPRDVVRKLGPLELGRVLGSYLGALPRRRGGEETLEQWVSNRFGRRLFELFFRTYTEKVWGVPASEIRAEWAAQRIKGLSLSTAVRDALFGNGGVKSLIREFHYPRLGPGQMWEAMAAHICELGGDVRTGMPVESIRLEGDRVVSISAAGEEIACEHVISSLPLRTLAAIARPGPTGPALAAAAGLGYRDFLTVALVLRGADPFPDNWVYVHDPAVKVGRIQNFRSWSPWMVPDPEKTCIGLEYFCFEGDELWSSSDDRLVELAASELERLGLGRRDRLERGYAVRVPKAYPVYDGDYPERLATVRSWLDRIENLQQVGRNGLHRYNNSDHSMLTAMRAVENVVAGADHDLWTVNADSVYHEEHVADEHPYRAAPETPAISAPLQS
jgi:protoporphyrinogen oxidase